MAHYAGLDSPVNEGWPLLKPYSKEQSRTYRLFLSRSESWFSQQYYSQIRWGQPTSSGPKDDFQGEAQVIILTFKSSKNGTFL
jgi:hypothetical protein